MHYLGPEMKQQSAKWWFLISPRKNPQCNQKDI